MSKLYNLAYISKNTICARDDVIEAEIKSIVYSAHKNNPVLGVTGALLYSGGYFCQVIEGPQEVLENLFETIQMDERHNDIAVLHFEPITERGFGEWAMALAGIEVTVPFDIEGVLSSKDAIKMQETGKHLVATLEQLVLQHQSLLKK